jgi:hypothetical protein
MPLSIARSRWTRLLLLSLCLLLTTLVVHAQDEEPPAPQFLYRDYTRLILINGYTGETAELPFEVNQSDQFRWSADGRFLAAMFFESEPFLYCLNLFEVDAMEWLYEEPISCAVHSIRFFEDREEFFYVTSGELSSTLWLFNPEDGTSEALYEQEGGSLPYSGGISDLVWSPTGTYLTFEAFTQIMGGTLNSFVVMNFERRQSIRISAPNPYYASYRPIWSDDDRWFLINLKEEYVYSAMIPRSNHQGDIYLINSDTGESSRLTYTPAVNKAAEWTEEGDILIREFITRHTTLTIEEAMAVEPIPREAIVYPERIDVEAFQTPRGTIDAYISPDTNLGAWVRFVEDEQGQNVSVLNIGWPYSMNSAFTFVLPEEYTLIGWRPSDYPYPQG